jgi:hypothetical protein
MSGLFAPFLLASTVSPLRRGAEQAETGTFDSAYQAPQMKVRKHTADILSLQCEHETALEVIVIRAISGQRLIELAPPL